MLLVLLGGSAAAANPTGSQRMKIPLALEVKGVGLYRMQADVRRDGENIIIRSESGGVQRAIGFWRGLFVALTSRQSFAGEMLRIKARGNDGADHSDSSGDAWVFSLGSAVANMSWDYTDPASLQVQLSRHDKNIATLKVDESKSARMGYGAVVANIRAALSGHYYAPRELAEKQWLDYLRGLEHASARSRDDLEFAVQAYLAKRALSVSHVGLERHRECRAPLPDEAGLETTWLGPDVLLVNASYLFLAPEELAALKETLGDTGRLPGTLILDLRKTSGGDLSAVGLASLLIDGPRSGGYFATSKWWSANDRVPQPVDIARAHALTSNSVDALQAALLREDLVRIASLANGNPFPGKVYVLTGSNTASAGEVLAAFLKSAGRATLVGAPTAGKMLSSARVCVGDGWVFQFPAADYYTESGERLEGHPTTPDIDSGTQDALGVVLAWIGLKPAAGVAPGRSTP
ncbi:MAG: S41 family peptidase [Xanthomonadaceae bacterium]|nr:S41 family peptidase [Xanthomonadaceae bacterium]